MGMVPAGPNVVREGGNAVPRADQRNASVVYGRTVRSADALFSLLRASRGHSHL